MYALFQLIAHGKWACRCCDLGFGHTRYAAVVVQSIASSIPNLPVNFELQQPSLLVIVWRPGHVDLLSNMWLRVGLQTLLASWAGAVFTLSLLSIRGDPAALHLAPYLMAMTAMAAVPFVAYLVSFMPRFIVVLLICSTCMARALSSRPA